MTFSILLSIILLLGGADGPTGGFNDSTAVSESVAASQSTTSTTPVKQKKGSFD